MKRKTSLTTVALSLSLVPGQRDVQLLPAGPTFRAQDGRPLDVPTGWKIDAQIASKLIAQLTARVNPMLIDYEHQTLSAPTSGKPAPAAGWAKQFEWREGQGLYAVDVAWTANAAQMIAAEEYKFISPVFAYDPKTGVVERLALAALTNNPALDGMDEVTALAAARYAADLDTENDDMDPLLELLRKALGLAADAKESAIQVALTAALGTHQTIADLVAERDQRIVALTANQYDQTRFVPLSVVTEANARIAELTATMETTERTSLMTAALSDGRVLPHMKAWMESQPLAALKSYLQVAQPIAALTQQQSGGNGPTGDATLPSLTPEQIAVCTNMGIDPKAYAEGLKTTTGKGN